MASFNGIWVFTVFLWAYLLQYERTYSAAWACSKQRRRKSYKKGRAINAWEACGVVWSVCIDSKGSVSKETGHRRWDNKAFLRDFLCVWSSYSATACHAECFIMAREEKSQRCLALSEYDGLLVKEGAIFQNTTQYYQGCVPSMPLFLSNSKIFSQPHGPSSLFLWELFSSLMVSQIDKQCAYFLKI